MQITHEMAVHGRHLIGRVTWGYNSVAAAVVAAAGSSRLLLACTDHAIHAGNA
jgi:hypothetical protein